MGYLDNTDIIKAMTAEEWIDKIEKGGEESSPVDDRDNARDCSSGSSTPPLAAGNMASIEPVRIDTTQQQRAVAFARDRRKAMYVYAVICAVILILLIIWALQSPLPLSFPSDLLATLRTIPLLNWQPIAGWPLLLVLVAFVLINACLLIITEPYIGYVYFIIPRHYGWDKNATVLHWLRSRSKTLLIRYVKAWLLVEVLTLFMVIQPHAWWAWTALVQFLFSLLMSRFGSRWLLPLLVKIAPLPDGELMVRLRMLLDKLHLPACDLLVMTSSRARAFFAGWGKGRCIVLTDHLVRNFTLDEIEVTLAHELAHLVHHDIWKRLVIRSMTFLGSFWLISLFLALFPTIHSAFSHLSLNQPSLLFLIISDLLLLLICRLFSLWTLLERRYSRYREYQADEFALQTTGNVPAFKSNMIRLSNMGMNIAVPTRYTKYSTHPPLVERLKHADEFAARQQ